MHFRAAGRASLYAIMIVLALAPITSAPARPPYCPDRAHASPEKVPAKLIAAVAKAFQIDDASVRDGAFVRCAGRKLMGCIVGANLNCFKADARRALPGATNWCREHPGSKGIPMSATGHDTIYEWTCKARRAVAGKAMMTVDPEGYVAENWKEIR